MDELTATWEFEGLDPANHYRVYVSWVPDEENADEVTYRLLSGATQLGGDVVVDQRSSVLTAGSTMEEGHVFRLLGTAAPLAQALTVELDATAAVGQVVADGVYLREYVAGQEIVTTVYDGLGQVARTFNELGEETSFTYDALGRTLTTMSPTGKTTRFIYDLLGQQTAVIDPSGNVTQFVYDDLGQKIEERITLDSTVYTRFFEYDAAGNQTLLVDRNGRAIQYGYDDGNRRTTEQWYPTAADAANSTNQVGYVSSYFDSAGRLQSAPIGSALPLPKCSFPIHLLAPLAGSM